MAKLQPEFAKRNVKILGLSVDPVTNHGKWAADIEETQGAKVNYPMIGDPQLKIAKTLRHAARRRRGHLRRPHSCRQCHGAHRFRRGPGQEDQIAAELSR